MELQFKKEGMSWLNCPVREVRNLEQTQELKLTDGMPDIGRVLAAWGQPILRGKEWNSDSFGISGGMMVWTLYAPEDGSPVRCVEGWIPYQMQWDLPSGTPEGQIRAAMLPRFMDARSVSPRKILIRAGMAAMGECFVPGEGSTFIPGEVPEDVQMLQNTYPVRLYLESGEKTFSLDEELTLPASCPEPRKLIYSTIHPQVEEYRVLGNRLVFRGNANLHVLYASEEGQLFSWDFPVSISQFVDLKESYSPEAQGELVLMVTDYEVNVDDEGHFRIKCGITAQYTVDDVKLIRTVQDAYSPARSIETEMSNLTMNSILDSSQQTMEARQQLHQEANVVADVSFLPDYPRQRRNADTLEMELPGVFQVLYYTSEGSLQASTARWEGKLQMSAHEDSVVKGTLSGFPMSRVEMNGDGMTLLAQIPLAWKTTAEQNISAISAVTLGQDLEQDPGRASMILCRAGEESLWELARNNGSTMEAIRKASGLEGEPAPGQMLLIPVM